MTGSDTSGTTAGSNTLNNLLDNSGSDTPPNLTDTVANDPATKPADQTSTMDDILKYLKLAGLLSGIGDGGGSTPLGKYTGAGTALNPTFSAKLPAANLPGSTSGFAARPAASLAQQTPQDWYRYGYGPEQSFFSHVPQGAPNTSRAFTGYEPQQPSFAAPVMPQGPGEAIDAPALPTPQAFAFPTPEQPSFAYQPNEEVMAFAHGGDVASGSPRKSFAVSGPGTGRSDDIDARLSDGEYVMDAETVALLGDGSSKAGADRLDQFRVNLRKHKGRNLAKGKFSVNAKKPEAYLAGGRK